MHKPIQVHVASPPMAHARRVLEEAVAPGIAISYGPEAPPPGTQVLVAGRPTKEQLDALPELHVLVVPYAGLHKNTRKLLLDSFPELVVGNLHHNAVAAAELAVALLLAAAKRIVPADSGLRSGDWRSRYDSHRAMLLEEKRALILGLGAIGTRVAEVCRALGMDVMGVRRRKDAAGPPGVEVHPPEALPSLLPQAEAMVICLPLTPETEGWIGHRELDALPSSAVLVNVARGPIVDEEALYRALQTRRIAAAGIDVWYRYPSGPEARAHTHPSRFPFHELDNVVLSPHRGGALDMEELEDRRMRDLATVLNVIARGDSVPHRVDVAAGY